MKIRLGTKILFLTLAMCVMLVVILTPLTFYFNKLFTSLIIDSSNNSSVVVKSYIKVEFEEITIDSLEVVAKSTADYLGHHIKDLTYKEVINSKEIHDISNNHFYRSGYTILINPEDYFVINYPDPNYNGKYLYDTPGYNEILFRPLIKALDKLRVEKGVSAKYKFTQKDGTVKEKNTYIAQMSEKTKDGVQLAIMATVYINDFADKAEHIRSIMMQKDNENKSLINSEADWFMLSIAIAILIVLIITVILSIIFSSKLSKNIIYITDECKKISEGNLGSVINIVNSNDEIEDLSKSVENMRNNLFTQTETIKIQAEKEKERSRELEEALDIAEEKTIQLVNQLKIKND